MSDHGKTFAEFFAGIGLVREGLRKSGWECVYANDIEPKKRRMYEANFREASHFDERDIWDTEGVLGCLRESPFLATASFPCTDLSLAGDYSGIDGKHSSTFFAFTRVIRQLSPRPPLLMFENVTGFLSANKGSDFKRAVTEIAELGYYIDVFVINAQAFVPQSRARVFIIAVHESIDAPLLIRRSAFQLFGDPWYQAVDQAAALRPKKLVHLMENTELPTGWVATPIRTPPQHNHDHRDIIALDDNQAWWNQEQLDKHYEMLDDAHRVLIDRYVSEGATFAGTAYRRKRQGRVRLEVRFDGVAGCLRTPSGGSGRQIVVAVVSGELKMRWMSPREYACLQGAERFKLVGSEREQLYGFGDAVCVPVISWIDECVLSPVFESHATVVAQ